MEKKTIKYSVTIGNHHTNVMVPKSVKADFGSEFHPHGNEGAAVAIAVEKIWGAKFCWVSRSKKDLLVGHIFELDRKNGTCAVVSEMLKIEAVQYAQEILEFDQFCR